MASFILSKAEMERRNECREDSDSEDDGSVCGDYGADLTLSYDDQVLDEDGHLAVGSGHFSFVNPLTSRLLTVYYMKSKKYKKENPPVFVFHGVYRNPDVYRDAWIKLAEEHGFFVIAPYFSEDHFPQSAGYNLGNIFASEKDRTPGDEKNWSYHVPGVIFDYISAQGKGDTICGGYVAYGHSAGSQYLHRKVAITPDPRLLLAIPSNAGWYTMPTVVDLWPYGWGGFVEAGIALPDNFLARYLAAPVIVQLGKNDIDKTHSNLRRTPEAMAQGANRLERGLAFYHKAKQLAQDEGFIFNWRLEFVEGVGHNSARMAPPAAKYITNFIKTNSRGGKFKCPAPKSLVKRKLAKRQPTAELEEEDNSIDFCIAIHGGAGVISKTDTVSEQYTQSLKDLIKRCHFFAMDDPSRTAVDIAEFAVNLLENDPLFNAGIGAVFTAEKTHELEASIMEGTELKCGAVALLTQVKNPISLARKVMEDGRHVWIAGETGDEIAEKDEDLLVVESNDEFSVARRLNQLERAQELGGVFNDHDSSVQEKKEGDADLNDDPTIYDEIDTETVGCVAMRNGRLCAATSTGGMTNKSCGRIGDTPIIGCGTYANDKTCAVSATGKGAIAA